MKKINIDLVNEWITFLKDELKDNNEIDFIVDMKGTRIYWSKSVGDSRISFLKLIKDLIKSSQISLLEATEMTNYLGRKTRDMYHLKGKYKMKDIN